MTNLDFIAERRSGVGGSDIAHMFSLGPYGCARRLFYEKRGIEPDRPQEVTGPMLRGLKFEGIVAEEYAEKTGRSILRVPLARHVDPPEWMCHRDFVTWGCKETPAPASGPGPLSIKTAGREVFFRMKREGLSDAYVLQLQSEMGVTGAFWGSYCIAWLDGWQVLWFDQLRDEDLITQIRGEVIKFSGIVENGPAPDRFPPEDQRCHRCPYAYDCQGGAMEALLQAQGQGCVCDTTLAPLVREFLETRELRDEAESVHEAAKEELRNAMGDRLLVEVPGAGKVQYAPNREWNLEALEIDRPDIARKFRVKWDLTALGKAHPELEKNYKRVGLTRPIRVYSVRTR